jgi:hypothetical protein
VEVEATAAVTVLPAEAVGLDVQVTLWGAARVPETRAAAPGVEAVVDPALRQEHPGAVAAAAWVGAAATRDREEDVLSFMHVS